MEHIFQSWTLRIFIVLLFSCFLPEWKCNEHHKESMVVTHADSNGQQGVEEKTSHPVSQDNIKILDEQDHSTGVGQHETEQKQNSNERQEDSHKVGIQLDTVTEAGEDNTSNTKEESIQLTATVIESQDEANVAKVDTVAVQEKPTSAVSTQEIKIDRPCFPDDQALEEEKARLESRVDSSKKEDGEKEKKLQDKSQTGETVKTSDLTDVKTADLKEADGKEIKGKEEEKTAEEEDIPSFDEWKKKKMAEQEMGRKVLTSQSVLDRGMGNGGTGSSGGQHRQFNLNQNSKNHASADCGAKILGSNSEAQSTSAILMQNRDVYMLNPCSAKIWFTVELCEPIQIKQLEVANFELFSSTPASFRIHVSDRYPSREWHVLGTFNAKDQRTLQSFSIKDQLMFTKYLKVEMLTFFGSEHYCPLSLLRVFGTSMEEEIIRDSESSSGTEENLDGDLLTDDDLIAGEGLKKTNLIAGAIADAVNNIVKHAAKVFTGSDDSTKPTACVDSDDNLHELRPCLPEEDPNITTQKPPEDKGCVAVDMENFDKDTAIPKINSNDKKNLTWKETLYDLCDQCTYCQKCDYSEYFPVCNYVKYMKAFQPITCKYFTVKTPTPQTQRTSSSKEKDRTKKSEKEEGKDEEKTVDVESDKTKEDAIKDSVSTIHISSKMESKRTTDIKSSESVPLSSNTMDKQPTDTGNKQGNIKTAPSPNGKDSIQGVAVEGSEVTREIKITTDMPKTDTEQKLKTDSPENIGLKTDQTEITKSKLDQVEPFVPVTTKSEMHIKSSETKPLDHVTIATPEIKETTSLNVENTVTATTIAEHTQITPTPSLTVEKTEAASTQDNNNAIQSTNENTASKAEPVAKTTDLHTEKEVKEIDSGQTEQSIGTSGSSVPANKESIFMRLNNRIKDLEYNMSLSQQYLQELSQKYRKQMEELQKTFNKTISKLTETSKEAESKDQKQEEAISSLEEHVVRLTNILQNVSEEITVKQSQMIERHFFLMLIEVLIISFLFLFCTSRHARLTPLVINQPSVVTNTPPKTKTKKKIKRRNSADGTINHKKLEMDDVIKRHQDDENIQIKGDYSSLLIIEPTKPLMNVLQGTGEKEDVKVHIKKYKSKVKGRSRFGSASSSCLDNTNSHDAHVSNQSRTNISSAGLIFSGSAHRHPAVEGSHTHPKLCNGKSIPKIKRAETFDRIETLYESIGTAESGKIHRNVSFPPSNKHRKGSHSRREKAGHLF
ncbi:SUN domain-containing ossification factor-like [Glandiceps talaboti]